MRRVSLTLLVGLGVLLAGCPKKSPSSIADDPEAMESDQDRAPDEEEPEPDEPDELDELDDLDPDDDASPYEDDEDALDDDLFED
jgi:hypothetical protein